ncbi:glyoxylase-like metal-dependent hydrolase (beta-lactamase superfamily II) [Deinobacterium chartae]|uniref:Glyoxylase-like metal-dependent hydrolase (Beta-lactamase superfamily II) n=1 Tax=Deinobacterium chartae TaxID=521158 RepID=A0A841HZ50_9DEIO|nr:MBL fold metallo-hydrolase [Deinobacterium chartae]MBB6097944.1 glyoxylase-like metal-dependent hydrolase (beta-lactamase superfamily II) [Deinobacterium chartae]
MNTSFPVQAVRLASPLGRRFGQSVWVYRYRDLLIDSGPPGTAARLRALPIARQAHAVLLTHHHEDHAGGAYALKVPVYAARPTLELLSAPQRIRLYRRLVWGTPRPLRVQLAPAGLPLRWIPTPGHSPDHHALFDAGEGVLFSGDAYLGVRARMGMPGYDFAALLRSLEDLIRLEPRVMYCAHAGRVERPVQRLQAKRDWLLEMQARAVALRAQGRSFAGVLRELLGPEGLDAFASGGELSKTVVLRSALEAAGQRP